MARPKVSDGEDTKIISFRIGASDHARVVAAAETYGKSLTEFARLAVLAATRGTVEGGGGSAVPSKLVPPAHGTPPPRPEPTHEHQPGKPLPTGLLPCTVKGCNARKVMDRWVEPE
jgi:hypothetical protein